MQNENCLQSMASLSINFGTSGDEHLIELLTENRRWHDCKMKTAYSPWQLFLVMAASKLARKSGTDHIFWTIFKQSTLQKAVMLASIGSLAVQVWHIQSLDAI